MFLGRDAVVTRGNPRCCIVRSLRAGAENPRGYAMKLAYLCLACVIPLHAACGLEVSSRFGPGWGSAQEIARLHVPIEGCETGPLALAVINATDLHVELAIDGSDVEFWTDDAVFGEIAPQEVAYLCLSDTGSHSISGWAYSARFDELVEVEGDEGTFDWHGSFGASTPSSGRNDFKMTSVLFFLH